MSLGKWFLTFWRICSTFNLFNLQGQAVHSSWTVGTWKWRQFNCLEWWEPLSQQHSFGSQNTWIVRSSVVETSNITACNTVGTLQLTILWLVVVRHIVFIIFIGKHDMAELCKCFLWDTASSASPSVYPDNTTIIYQKCLKLIITFSV